MKLPILTLFLFIIATSSFAQKTGVSPYIFPEFMQASVLQKGGGVTEATMNYNTVTQEMLFMQNGVKTVLDMDNVDTIYISNRKFIPVGKVYYEKLTDTKIALYRQNFNKPLLNGRNPNLADQVNNTITASQGIRNSSTSAAIYELKLGEGYTLQPESVYWLQKGKSFYSAADLKKILKVFPPNKEQAVNAYINDKKLDITQPDDLAKVIIFCNLQ